MDRNILLEAAKLVGRFLGESLLIILVETVYDHVTKETDKKNKDNNE